MSFLDPVKPYFWIIEIIAFVLLVGAVVIAIDRHDTHQQKVGYDKADGEWKAKDARAKQVALAKDARAKQVALAKERQLIQQKEDAENAAAKRQIELETSITDLRHQLDGMRFAASEQRKRIATLTVDAARRVADAGITVFGECAAEYSKVAVAADKSLSERQTLIEAWPK